MSDNISPEDVLYQVEAIRDREDRDDGPYYLIKWEGYPEKENTWEPLCNCQRVMHLIEEFDEIRRTRSESSGSDSNRGRKSKRATTTSSRRPGRRNDSVTKTEKSNCREATTPIQKFDKKTRTRSRSTASTQTADRNRPNDARRIDIGETSQQFEDLTINTENFQTRGEPVVPRLSDSEPMEVQVEFSRKSTTQGRTPKHTCVRTTRCDPTRRRPPFNMPAYSIQQLQMCSSEEIEIVGAEPYANDGINVGVRVVDDNHVFKLDSSDVTELWPKPYIAFLEKHIRFEPEPDEN